MGQTQRAARLSPRQSQGSAGARRARIDRGEGAGRLHLRRCRALGGRQPGRALPAFPRPRRAARRRRAARLRAVRRGAGEGLGRRQAGRDAAPSSGSARPISISPSASRPITRRCSRPACRSTPIRNCARPARRAFAVLRAAAEKLVAQMPARGRPPALMVALHIWSMTHGIASLFGRGDAARRALPMSPEELLEAACWSICAGSACRCAQRPRPSAEAGRARNRLCCFLCEGS